MNHDHDHAHPHSHAHVHAPTPPAVEGTSVLMQGALSRLLAAAAAIAVLWGAVAWALTDLAA